MILGLGSDIIEISRIEASMTKHGALFLDRLFTQAEQSYCQQYKKDAFRHFAGRFTAKEAISKALGTGFGHELGFLDIEILNNQAGKPLVYFSAKAKIHFNDPKVQLSISHSKTCALAVAIWEA